MLRKSFDIKFGVSSKKFDDRFKGKYVFVVIFKEDSWILFKLFLVFLVDNSSVKIVFKISYVSKVKENFNKIVQNFFVLLFLFLFFSSFIGEIQIQFLSRLFQVFMLVLKFVISVSFFNGFVLVGIDVGVYFLGGQLLLIIVVNILIFIFFGIDLVFQDMSLILVVVE